MMWHHQRLEKRIERYRYVLSSIMVLAEERCRDLGALSDEDRVNSMLEAMVFALQNRWRHKFKATVLLSERDGLPFSVYAQWSRHSGERFDDMIAIDDSDSVAGIASRARSGELVYVPWTKCRHGVQMTDTTSPHAGRRFWRTEIVPNAFQKVETQDPSEMGCLLCIKIPKGNAEFRRYNEEARAVLCLSSVTRNCLGDLEFTTMRAAAGLISAALGF
jgi:hypothetical protein